MSRWYPETLFDRFFRKVEAISGGCWNWRASVDNRGYGQINTGTRPEKAHRIAYALLVGEIPEGLTLDHLCRNVKCVNPTHLEPVTRRENTLRQLATLGHPRSRVTHCPNGHLYVERYRGVRICRPCRAVDNRAYRARKRLAA